jgi:hypothetical protein
MGRVKSIVILSIWLLLSSTIVMGQDYFHPIPYPPDYRDKDNTLTCQELDRELNQLLPLLYTNKPGFYNDPAHGASFWGGFIWPPALTYLGYSALVEYNEIYRVDAINRRINALRQLKANRRCYER